MEKRSLYASLLSVIVVGAASSLFGQAVDVGTAGNYAVVDVGGTASITSDFKLYQSATVINGNVAEGPHTTLQHGIDATVNGRWDYDLTDQNPLTEQPKSNTPSGGFRQVDLSGVASDARTASAAAAALAPTQTFASLSDGQTITGVGGLNVIRITGDSTIKTYLTLSGTASSLFVFQFTSSTGAGSDVLSLSGMTMNLLGGVQPGNIVWDLNGLGGNLNINAMSPSQLVDGIFLAPDRNITVDHGNILGEVIGGGSGTLLNIHSGSQITQVPEPSMVGFLIIALSVATVVWIRRRQKAF